MQRAEQLAEQLAKAEWHGYSSRPRTRKECSGYFVVLRWYGKEKVWVPLYMQHGNISNLLAKVYGRRKSTPICKYLSSFPRTQRNLLQVKWVLEPSDSKEVSGEILGSLNTLAFAFFVRKRERERVLEPSDSKEVSGETLGSLNTLAFVVFVRKRERERGGGGKGEREI